MKKCFIYLGILSALFTSCEEDFLNPDRNTNILTDVDFVNNIPNNPALIEGTLAGIGGYMVDPFATVPNSRHYDIGQKGIDIFSDIVSGDTALSASSFGWYNNTSNMVVTTDFTREENELVWNYYFRIISLANTVIISTGGNNPESSDDTVLRINAQAKAYRAYAYFYLTQFYQQGFNPSQPILPLYSIDQTITGKATAGEIYNLILSDLNFAINTLDGFTRQQKSEIDKTVAQGLLAYTHAAMGNYVEARQLSEEIINEYPLTTEGQLAFPGPGAGFNNVNTPSWIWGFDITADLDHVLVNWWGQMDYFTFSYAWAGDTKSIDNLLYSQIPSNDIRSTQFGTGAADLQPINKFFDNARVVGGQNVITTDYIFMRVEEFYLLSAEASANMGDEASAKNRLRDLLQIRMGGTANADAYLNPITGQDLVDEVHLQTRIELWGEGKSYLAMKRNQATVTRGSNHVFRANETFSYNSDEFTFQIPETEIINNPNISTQND